MPIVVTVKIRPRYGVFASPSTPQQVHLFDKIGHKAVIKRHHQDSYSLLDWAHTANYLNDRVSGYPVPSALLTLRSEHNEDRRRAGGDYSQADLARAANRRRPARGKGRGARK